MTAVAPSRTRPATDPLWIRVLALTAVIGFLGGMILLPLATVFVEALSRGLQPAWEAIREHDALAALQLTLLIAAIAVPFNALFGICASWAVSVVSGHIRGRTDTLPLHVEILYNEYDFVGAFAVAGLLCLMALVTLALKTLLEIARPELDSHGV